MDWALGETVGEIGWGGRIRTFTILINSEVSYRLDHAPAGVFAVAASGRAEGSRPSLQKWEGQTKNSMGKVMSKDGMNKAGDKEGLLKVGEVGEGKMGKASAE